MFTLGFQVLIFQKLCKYSLRNILFKLGIFKCFSWKFIKLFAMLLQQKKDIEMESNLRGRVFLF